VVSLNHTNKQEKPKMIDKWIHNGVLAPTERSARRLAFIALGFDFDTAFDLACGDLVKF
jgi:hypothetical protein